MKKLPQCIACGKKRYLTYWVRVSGYPLGLCSDRCARKYLVKGLIRKNSMLNLELSDGDGAIIHIDKPVVVVDSIRNSSVCAMMWTPD